MEKNIDNWKLEKYLEIIWNLKNILQVGILEVWRKFGNLEKIWKFGKYLEIWKKKLEIREVFGNLEKNWKIIEI